MVVFCGPCCSLHDLWRLCSQSKTVWYNGESQRLGQVTWALCDLFFLSAKKVIFILPRIYIVVQITSFWEDIVLSPLFLRIAVSCCMPFFLLPCLDWFYLLNVCLRTGIYQVNYHWYHIIIAMVNTVLKVYSATLLWGCLLIKKTLSSF